MLKGIPFCLLACCAILQGSAFAVPGYPVSQINIHGTLLKADGTALTGTRAYQIQFYDDVTGGSALGGEITGTVALSSEGLFNIAVSLPAQVLAASQAFYEIGIDIDDPADNDASDDVFADRVRVYSVPFALHAAEVAHVDAAQVGNGDVDDAELSALDGASGNLQTQIDGFDAYSNLTSNSKIGGGSGQVAAGDHSHAFDDLSGSLSTDDFSAFDDLSAESKLDNDDDADLLTRGQADARYAAAGAGSATFNAIGSGTNTSASMVVGTGATLGASGTGTITATAVASNAVTPSGLNGLGGNGTSGQLIQTDGDGSFSFVPAGSGPTKVVKTSDTTYTGTTLTNDPHLQFSVEANSIYYVEGMLIAEENVDGSDGDLKLTFSVPAGTSFYGDRFDIEKTFFNHFQSGTLPVVDSYLGVNPSAGGIRVTIVTGANAGTVNMQFSQYFAVGEALVRTGTFLLVTKLN